ADLITRRLSTHPETRLFLIGYLGPADGPPAAELPRLGSAGDISAVARGHEGERGVVTAQAMRGRSAEAPIEEGTAGGRGPTLPPPRPSGLPVPGMDLNRLAELRVLDFRFSAPPRSTMALKRAMDVAVSGLLLALLSPLLLLIALAILIDTGRPVFFRQ